MYSIVLMMSMTSPAEAPAGVLFNRTGCGGAVRTVRAVLAVRPVRTLFFRWFESRQSASCGSRLFGFRFREVHRVRGAGVTTAPVIAVPQVAEAAGVADLRFGFVTRTRVRAQLNAALRQADAGKVKLTAKQRQAVRKALADPDVFEVAVVKVHRDMGKGVDRAIGDGTILKLILDNLPAILDAILRIIDALGAAGSQGGAAAPALAQAAQ